MMEMRSMRWMMMIFITCVVTFILLSVCGQGWMFENGLSYGITLECKLSSGPPKLEIVGKSQSVDLGSSGYSMRKCDLKVMRNDVGWLRNVPIFDGGDERWQKAALGATAGLVSAERLVWMTAVSEEEETVSLYVNAFFWAKAYLREGKVYFMKKYDHVWKPVEINSKEMEWSYERTMVISNSVSHAELEILWPCHFFKSLEKKHSKPSLLLAPHSVTIVGIKFKDECSAQQGKPKIILKYKKDTPDYGGDQITYIKDFPFHDVQVYLHWPTIQLYLFEHDHLLWFLRMTYYCKSSI